MRRARGGTGSRPASRIPVVAEPNAQSNTPIDVDGCFHDVELFADLVAEVGAVVRRHRDGFVLCNADDPDLPLPTFSGKFTPVLLWLVALNYALLTDSLGCVFCAPKTNLDPAAMKPSKDALTLQEELQRFARYLAQPRRGRPKKGTDRLRQKIISLNEQGRSVPQIARMIASELRETPVRTHAQNRMYVKSVLRSKRPPTKADLRAELDAFYKTIVARSDESDDPRTPRSSGVKNDARSRPKK